MKQYKYIRAIQASYQIVVRLIVVGPELVAGCFGPGNATEIG